jgi:hypothetical protein
VRANFCDCFVKDRKVLRGREWVRSPSPFLWRLSVEEILNAGKKSTNMIAVQEICALGARTHTDLESGGVIHYKCNSIPGVRHESINLDGVRSRSC